MIVSCLVQMDEDDASRAVKALFKTSDIVKADGRGKTRPIMNDLARRAPGTVNKGATA